MSVATGKPLGGLDHVRQSIRDILMTPTGTRVMLRDYGTPLFGLVDKPITPETRMEIYSAVVAALYKWEPRVRVNSVSLVPDGPGHISLTLDCTYLPDGKPILLDGIVI